MEAAQASVPPAGVVLVVDDEAAIRTLYCRALERAGYRCVAAADASEALGLIEDHVVSVVLLDANLPGMSGRDLLARLRANEATRTIPVIMVTGDDAVADRVSGLSAGADDYLVKPVHLDELLARVRATLRGQQAWAALLEQDLRERAAIASALTRIEAGDSPEQTAAAVCDAVTRLLSVPFASVVAFAREGWAIPLAVQGPPDTAWRVGLPLPERQARSLRERALLGPWIEPGSRPLPTTAGLALGTSRVATMNAPLVSGGDVMGLLVVGLPGDQGGGTETLTRGLRSVIDLAAVAALLLGPQVLMRVRRETDGALLETVIRERAFTPVFQPILELGNGKIVGYEALTRFDDGADPALRFAEAARRGLGIALEAACLRSAIDASRGLPSGCWLSLNVSPALVLEGSVLPRLVRTASREVMVELTEHDPVEDYAQLRAALALLGDVPITVDDAGSGYSSMRHIRELRPSFAKLDIDVVRDLQGDEARRGQVKGMLYFANTIGCDLIAEGIEQEAQQTALGELEVRFGQGFLLGEPRPVA